MNISNTLLKLLLPWLPTDFRKRIIRGGLPDFKANLDGVTFCEASSFEDYISCSAFLSSIENYPAPLRF